MQFKESGAKVEVLVYAGLDQKKGQPLLKKLGSFDKYTYKPSPGLLDKLNPEQRDQLAAECERRHQAAIGLNRQHYVASLAANLRGASDSLRNGASLTEQQSAETWDAIGELLKAMREAGYPRPTRRRRSRVSPAQPDLLETSLQADDEV